MSRKGTILNNRDHLLGPEPHLSGTTSFDPTSKLSDGETANSKGQVGGDANGSTNFDSMSKKFEK